MRRAPRRKVITSINLEPEDMAVLRALAARERVPLAYKVRQAVEHYLSCPATQPSAPSPVREAVAVG